ncbi:hypothetical protein DER45DRAFT_624307 [Fusarium avenaceum]|nr:hypothetical protein DER45DRAFT_624307 [Fusarium avenaceum]
MVLLSVFLSVFATGAAASKCRPSSNPPVSNTLTSSSHDTSWSTHLPETAASQITSSELSSTTQGPLVVDNLIVNGNLGTPGQDSIDIYGFQHGLRARALSQGGYTGSNTGETECAELSILPEGRNPRRKRQADTDRSTSIWQHIIVPHARPVFRLFYKVLQVDDGNDCKVNVYYGDQLFLSSDSFQGLADWRAISGMPTLTTLSSDLRFELRCINPANSPAQILVDQMFMSGAIGLGDLDRVKIDWKAATLVSPTMSSTISDESTQAEHSMIETQSTSETALSSQAATSDSATSTETKTSTNASESSASQPSSMVDSELATSIPISTSEASTSKVSESTSSGTTTPTSLLMSGSFTVSESSFSSDSNTFTFPESTTSAAPESTSTSLTRSESTTSESIMSTSPESTSSAYESTTANPSSSTEPSSITSWTLTVSATVSPSSTTSSTTKGPGPLPSSINDLSPAAKEIFDFLMDRITPEDRNLHLPAPAQSDADKVLHPSKFDPNDTAGQKALAGQLLDMGLDPVDDFVKSAEGKIPSNDPEEDDGVCPNPNTSQKRSLPPVLRRRDTLSSRRLNSRFAQAARRLDNYLAKRDGWDYACNEMLGEFMGVLGDVGTAHELVCSGKDMWDTRDAFVCMFGGCGPTVKYEEWTYTWNYEWVVDFPTISEWLVQPGDGSSLRCLDCSMKLTSLKFTGTIVVWLIDGKVEIKSANLSPEVVGKANMVMALEAVRAWDSQWNWVFEAAPLETIEEKGAYSIRSKVLYEFGIKWKTASAVSVAKAGASFSLNAQANMDISNGGAPTLQSKKGWEPQITYTYPVFTTSGGISLIPYIRWGVEFDIDIYNQVRLKPALSSQTLVTIQSSYSDEPQGQCAANKLAVSTYMSTKSVMKLRNGVYDTLYSGSSRAFNQCFEAPDMIPTAEDINELSEFAGEFCTSYLDYRPPRTTSISTATSTSGLTTTTEYVTSWVPPTAQYVILTTTEYKDQTGWIRSTAITYTQPQKTATFPNMGLKKREATATQSLAARAIYTPGLVANWDSKKISFACKQIATGTETVTQPVTTTIGVGIATVTATTTVARPGGDVKFYTNGLYKWRNIGSTEYSESWKWETGACGSPSARSGKCFKIRINGPKWTDGEYLRYSHTAVDSIMASNGGFPYLNLDTWYLTETGRLVTQHPYIKAGYVAAVQKSTNIIFGTPAGDPIPDDAEALYCQKDPNDVCSGVLSCSTDTRNGLSFSPRIWENYRNFLDSKLYNAFRPRLGDSTPGSEMATFTWEGALCACD